MLESDRCLSTLRGHFHGFNVVQSDLLGNLSQDFSERMRDDECAAFGPVVGSSLEHPDPPALFGQHAACEQPRCGTTNDDNIEFHVVILRYRPEFSLVFR